MCVAPNTGVNHFLLNLSITSTLILLTLKVYLEQLRPDRNTLKLSYETHRKQTHLCIALIVISSLLFNLSLYPRYGFTQTMIITSMVGYGVLWQFFMLVPYSLAQNLAGIVGATYFLQEYAGVGVITSFGH